MIGRLKGTLHSKHPPQLLLDVGGVGYELDAPMSTFYQLPALGNEVILYTHLVVRDDAHLLFGFATEPERRAFRSLIKVNGVGARLALTILSSISIEDFARCVREDDSASLTRLHGVGKKTAERLIVEMRDRLDDWQDGGVDGKAQITRLPAGVNREAISALVALGYRSQEASRMVSSIDGDGLSSEDIIKAALKATVA